MKLFVAIAFMTAFVILMTPLGFAQDATTSDDETIIAEFNDIEPYSGNYGPESNLYQVKLILERIDEVLTFDPVRKIEKKLEHAKTRLAEAKGEIIQNRIANANKILELGYENKIVEVNADLVKLSEGASIAMKNRLEASQIKAEQHKLVIQSLIDKNPDAIHFEQLNVLRLSSRLN